MVASGWGPFKDSGIDVTKMAVKTGFIVKDFDAIEDMGTGELSVFIDPLANPLFLWDAKKGCSNGIVPAVASPTHNCLKVMGSAEMLPIIAVVF